MLTKNLRLRFGGVQKSTSRQPPNRMDLRAISLRRRRKSALSGKPPHLRVKPKLVGLSLRRNGLQQHARRRRLQVALSEMSIHPAPSSCAPLHLVPSVSFLVLGERHCSDSASLDPKQTTRKVRGLIPRTSTTRNYATTVAKRTSRQTSLPTLHCLRVSDLGSVEVA